MEHKPPTPATIYKLYGSSKVCAFPDCTEPHIVVDANTNVKVANTEVCHICARRKGGPRWNPDQTEDENRSDDNLVLLCRKHHAFVDDRANLDHYRPELLRAWKAEQEKQGSTTLTPDDVDAIERGNIEIVAEQVMLGGLGGMAPGAGGGGGGAIGHNSKGGTGGNGGRYFHEGMRADPSTLRLWSEIIHRSTSARGLGSGGGGVGATGDNSAGGCGGDGGDLHTGTLTVTAGKLHVNVGRGAHLPGEIGGSSFLENVDENGHTYPIGPKAHGGWSGDSYLPEDVPVVSADLVARGFRINCLAMCDDAALNDGVFSVERIGWSSIDIGKLPAAIIFKVVSIVTKRPEDKGGFFVSLFVGQHEKARVAVPARESPSGHFAVSSLIRIGATFDSPGECRIIAHGNGILLCESLVEIRSRHHISARSSAPRSP